MNIKNVSKDVEMEFKRLSDLDGFKENDDLFLKKLLEMYEGFYPKGTEEQDTKIDILSEEINLLKSRIEKLEEKKQEKEIVTVSGKTIRRN